MVEQWSLQRDSGDQTLPPSADAGMRPARSDPDHGWLADGHGMSVDDLSVASRRSRDFSYTPVIRVPSHTYARCAA